MKKMIIAIVIIILIIIMVVDGYKIYEYCIEFRLDNANKYLVITNTRFATMRNDGGSHENIYYGVDLEKGEVTKYQQSVNVYLELDFTTDITKIVFHKSLEENDVEELRTLLNDIYSETNHKEEDTEKETLKNVTEEITPQEFLPKYQFYTVSNMSHGEIDVYNEEFIQNFLNIVEK